MIIRFVNHASFICEHDGVRLICDPWLYGSAFNDGWDLVAESRFKVEEFANIHYVWFSHEHPDHFSPRVLLDIPKELRSKITVLYKQTTDKKVLGFCKKQGFDTRELPEGEPFAMRGGWSVTCRSVPLHDSWLVVEAPGCRLVNLNDAVVDKPHELRALRKKLGKIEVLFTQFNYAAWRGNREDSAVRRSDAAEKLNIMRRQVEYLRPAFTVPFASFSYFSHEENAFTNDSANSPKTAVSALAATASTPVLLYPDDCWEVGSHHDNASALDRYAQDYAHLAGRPLRKSAPIDFKDLSVSATRYIARIQEANDSRMLSVLRKIPVFPLLGEIEVFLWDLDRNVRFSFERGLESIAERSSKYDLAMSSDSLGFLFKHAWGIDTLTVNGRFHADAGGLKQLVATFGVDAINNAGIRLTPAFLIDSPTISFLVRILVRKLWSLKRQSPDSRPASFVKPGGVSSSDMKAEH